MYEELDAARERAEAQLTQLLLNRKMTVSKISQRSSSGMLHSPGLWVLQLNGAVLNYANAANIAIVTRVMALPRELRDSIYMRLWEPSGKHDPNRDLLYWWEHFDEPWTIKGISPCSSNWTASLAELRPPHFVDQRFVGGEFAKEVLTRFKDTVGKDLRQQEDKNPIAEFALIDASMEAFVKKDAFGVGITVAELVRNLDIRINFQCDALEGDENANEIENKDIALQTETKLGRPAAESYLAELEAGVTALLTMYNSQRITIHDGCTKQLENRPRIISLMIRQESSVHSKESSLVPVLGLVARTYHGLREKGFTVGVQYHSEEVGMKFLFEDDVWLWSNKDWENSMRDKNLSEVETEDWFPEKQVQIWGNIREFLFNGGNDGPQSGD